MKVQSLIRKYFGLALVMLLLGLSACESGGGSGGSNSPVTQTNPGSSDSTNSASSGYPCTLTELDTMPIGQDPTQDFSVSNVVQTASLVTSTCGYLEQVQSTHTYSSVTRSGNLITTVDSSGSDSITLSNNQATVSQSDLVTCSNGVEATGTFTELELDPISGNIRVYSNWTFVSNGCITVTPAVGQGAPASIVYDYLPPSDPSPNLVAIGNAYSLNGTSTSLSYNPSQCDTFEAFGTNAVGSSLGVECNAGTNGGLVISFEFPTGTAPAVGMYVTLTDPVSSQQAVINYEFGLSDGGGSTGRYGYLSVLSLQFDQAGTVSSFEAEFEILSASVAGTPTYGTVRYNSQM